jgi:translation initiation factor 2 beta subunit (eIF-2beta)/eIF-5
MILPLDVFVLYYVVCSVIMSPLMVYSWMILPLDVFVLYYVVCSVIMSIQKHLKVESYRNKLSMETL